VSKTNACRILDELAIRYELRHYDVDPDDLSAETVAGKIGMPIVFVYKTLCIRADDRSVGFAVIAGNDELDLKAYARLAGKKSADLVPLKEVQPLTGYIRGGVTALGAKKAYPVFVDEAITSHERVSISAGIRGTQILIAPADYLAATKAKLGPLARR
jgi:Cys-tRNA(Pro)/Cys-tRNA(Cys) deacylase